MGKVQFVTQATVRFFYHLNKKRFKSPILSPSPSPFLSLKFFHFLRKQKVSKRFLFVPFFILWTQCLVLATSAAPNSSLAQPKRASWYDKSLQRDYLSQQYLNDPLLYARHKFTLNGNEQALKTMNQFLDGKITAPEARRKLSGSLRFLGFEARGSLSNSSVTVGTEVNLGVAGFSFDFESKNPTEAQRAAYQREIFIQGIRENIYVNPEEVRLQAKAVVENQTKYKDYINFINFANSPNENEYNPLFIEIDNGVKYSFDGGESFQTILRKDINLAKTLNQISKDHNILYRDFKTRYTLPPIGDLVRDFFEEIFQLETSSNKITLTQNIEQHHPELKIPYQIGNFQRLTDEALASIRAGQSSLEDHFEVMNLSYQKLQENMYRALELNIETNIHNIAKDITQGIIDFSDIDPTNSSTSDTHFNDSSDIVNSIYFRVETNIRAIYPSSNNTAINLETHRKIIQKSIDDANQKIRHTNRNIQLQKQLLAENPNLSQDPLKQAQKTLNEEQKRKDRSIQTLKNIETKELKFNIARSRMAVQSVTSVLSLVGIKEAETLNRAAQSSLTAAQGIGEILKNGLNFSNMFTLTQGVSGLINLISNTPSIEQQMLGKLNEVLNNQMKIMRDLTKIIGIVERTEEKVGHLINMVSHLYDYLDGQFINIEDLILQMNKEMKRDFTIIKDFYVTISQDAALRPTFQDIASIHDLFNNRVQDPIRLELIECKNKEDPENECTQTARNQISRIRITLANILFHIENTLLKDKAFLSTVNFFEIPEIETSSYLKTEEEMVSIFGAKNTHFSLGVEGKTGMLQSLGMYLNNHENRINQEVNQEAREDQEQEEQKEVLLVNTKILKDVPNPRLLYTLFNQYVDLAMYLPTYEGNRDNNINKICTFALKANEAASELRKSIKLAWDVYRLYLEQYRTFYIEQLNHAKDNFANALSNKIDRNFLLASDSDIKSYVDNNVQSHYFSKKFLPSELKNTLFSIPGTYEVSWKDSRKCTRYVERCENGRCLHYHRIIGPVGPDGLPRYFSDTGKLYPSEAREYWEFENRYRFQEHQEHEEKLTLHCLRYEQINCHKVCAESIVIKIENRHPKKQLLINKIISERNNHLNALKSHLLGKNPNTRDHLNENARNFALARLALETTIRGGFGDENINYHFESLQPLRRIVAGSPSLYFNKENRSNDIKIVIARESDFNQNFESFKNWLKRIEKRKLVRVTQNDGETRFDLIPEKLLIPSTNDLESDIQKSGRQLGFGNPTGIKRLLLDEISGVIHHPDLKPSESCIKEFRESLTL